MSKKICVVTGGASGMGLSLAEELGKLGPVFIGGRTESKIARAIEGMKAKNIEAYGKPCDVSDLESVRAFAKAAAEIAPIGNVINAAGISFDAGDIEMILNINAQGTINVDNVFLPLMDGGVMINFASNTGWTYNPTEEDKAIWDEPDAPDFVAKCAARVDGTFAAYCYSKRFVIFHSMANATRYAARNCRVLSISPGAFETPMLMGQTSFASIDKIAAGTALKRVGTPLEMSRTVIAVMDPSRSYLTGTDIMVDGGKIAMNMTKQLV